MNNPQTPTYRAKMLVIDDENRQCYTYRLSVTTPNLSLAIKEFRKFLYGLLNSPNKYTPMRNIYVEEIGRVDSKYYISEYSHGHKSVYRIRDTPKHKSFTKHHF